MNKLFDDLLIECAENNYKKGYQKAKKETLLMCAKNELENKQNLNKGLGFINWVYKTSNEERIKRVAKNELIRIDKEISQIQKVIKKLEEMK